LRWSREESEFDRAIGFLDATFALALTLLVTTLDVSGVRSVWESLGSLDDAVGSQFIAFAISFALIADYWLVHHRLIASFDALDTPVIVANLFLIAAVVLLPFSTEVVGDPAIDDLALPTAVFALDVAAASVMLTIIYWLAWKRDLFRSRPSRPELRANLIASAVPAVVFIASIPIAYLATPTAAKLSWLSLLILDPIGGTRRRSKSEPPEA
jgi:uncharacterized membrane protein